MMLDYVDSEYIKIYIHIYHDYRDGSLPVCLQFMLERVELDPRTHTYIYIHIYIYTHIHIYIYIHGISVDRGTFKLYIWPHPFLC